TVPMPVAMVPMIVVMVPVIMSMPVSVMPVVSMPMVPSVPMTTMTVMAMTVSAMAMASMSVASVAMASMSMTSECRWCHSHGSGNGCDEAKLFQHSIALHSISDIRIVRKAGAFPHHKVSRLTASLRLESAQRSMVVGSVSLEERLNNKV